MAVIQDVLTYLLNRAYGAGFHPPASIALALPDHDLESIKQTLDRLVAEGWITRRTLDCGGSQRIAYRKVI